MTSQKEKKIPQQKTTNQKKRKEKETQKKKPKTEVTISFQQQDNAIRDS